MPSTSSVTITREEFPDIFLYSPLEDSSYPDWFSEVRPAVISIFGAIPSDITGISTSVEDIYRFPSIVNHVALRMPDHQTSSTPSGYPKSKLRLTVEEGVDSVNRFLRRVTYTFSDIVCIHADTVDDAAQEFLNWSKDCDNIVEYQNPPLAVVV